VLFESYCERHRSVTLVEVEPLRPMGPPDKHCVACIGERIDPEPDCTGTATHFETTRGPFDPDSLPPRLREVYIRKLAALRERGHVVSGSDEEATALARMDAARDEAVWYDHASPAERRRRAQRRQRGSLRPSFGRLS
jgi:hypothetical protein